MTNIDLLIGMSFIDDQLVDEALRYKRASSSAVKWGLLAACIGIAFLVGFLALRHGRPNAAAPDGPGEQLSEPIISPSPAPATTAPADRTPEPQPQETPSLREPSGEIAVPVPTPASAETAPPANTPAAQTPQQTDNRRPDTQSSAPDTPAPGMPSPVAPSPSPQTQPTPAPEEPPLDNPEPLPTPEQSSGEIVIPTVPPDAWQLEPQPESWSLEPEEPDWEYLNRPYGLQHSVEHQVGEPIPVDFVRRRLTDDTIYTDLQFETDGFEILSREQSYTWTSSGEASGEPGRVPSGERITLALSPELPEGKMAVLTIRVMDGGTVKDTLYFYGLLTDKGVFASDSTGLIWNTYYYACYLSGEYTWAEYNLIESFITSPSQARQEMLEDPVRDLDLSTAAGGSSGEAGGVFTDEPTAEPAASNPGYGLFIDETIVNPSDEPSGEPGIEPAL